MINDCHISLDEQINIKIASFLFVVDCMKQLLTVKHI